MFSKTRGVCKLFHGLLSFVSEPLVRGLQRSCGHVNWSPQASGQPQREYLCLPQNIAKLLSLNNYEVLLKNCTYIPMGNFWWLRVGGALLTPLRLITSGWAPRIESKVGVILFILCSISSHSSSLSDCKYRISIF